MLGKRLRSAGIGFHRYKVFCIVTITALASVVRNLLLSSMPDADSLSAQVRPAGDSRSAISAFTDTAALLLPRTSKIKGEGTRYPSSAFVTKRARDL